MYSLQALRAQNEGENCKYRVDNLDDGSNFDPGKKNEMTLR